MSKSVIYSLIPGEPGTGEATGALSVAWADHPYLEDEDGDLAGDEQFLSGAEEIQVVSDHDVITFFHLLSERFFLVGTPFENLRQRVESLSRTPRSLPEALERRNRWTVSSYLQEHFEESATGEYDWIAGLQKLGYSYEDMAKLLHESATDSPWIFHEPGDITTAELSVGYHQHGCPHRLLSDAPQHGVELQESDSEMESSLDEVASTSESKSMRLPRLTKDEHRAIEQLCGLGGVSPISRDTTKWRGDVHFEDKGRTAHITISSPSAKAVFITPEDTQGVLDRLEEIVLGLSRALGSAQDAGLCCSSLTVLSYSHPPQEGPNPGVRLVSAEFSDIETLLEALDELWEKDISDIPNEWSAATFGPFLGQIFPDATLPSQELAHSGSLHMASLVLQLLCVGLLSYKQAHVGGIRPFFLDTAVRELYLLGGAKTNSSWLPSIHARLEELTCLSPMTKGPVLVFYPSWAGDVPPPQAAPKFNVRGTPESILDTWGPGHLVSRGDDLGCHIAMQIGCGFIYPSDVTSSPSMYHFGPDLHVSSESPRLSLGTQIVVGDPVSEHSSCPNIENIAQCWEASDRRHQLSWVAAHRSYWKLHQRQAGMQAGPDGVAFQAVAVQENRPAEVVKNRILFWAQPASSRFGPGFLIEHLNHQYGLRVSFCTTIAQRVPLRRVVADLLPEVAAALTDPKEIKLWTRLRDEYSAVATFCSPDTSLRNWFTAVLPADLHELMHDLICMVLHALRSTGLDPEGRYCTLLWLHNGRVEHGFKIPIGGHTRWVSMLKDTENCATFAYITNSCLVSGEILCRGPTPKWPNKIHFLETAVFIEEAGDPVGLQNERVYYFTMDDQTLWFEARSAAGVASVPNELVCLNFAVSFPLKVAARLPLLGERYIRARMLAENHLSGSLAERVKVRSGA